MSCYTNLPVKNCKHEKEYISVQQRGYYMMLNDRGIDAPTVRHVTYEMFAEDNFKIDKMEHIVVWKWCMSSCKFG